MHQPGDSPEISGAQLSITSNATVPNSETTHMHDDKPDDLKGMDFYDLLLMPRERSVDVDKEVKRRFDDLAERHGQDLLRKVFVGGSENHELIHRIRWGPERHIWNPIAAKCFKYWQWKEGGTGIKRWMGLESRADDWEFEESDDEGI